MFLRRTVLFLFLGLCLLSASVPEAAQWDDQTKAIANQTMLNIYKEILSAKARFPELYGFGEHNLRKNAHGVYRIEYKHELIDSTNQIRPFAFGLSIAPEEDKDFSQKEQAFSFGFPLLGIKFAGYQVKLLKKKQFDILDLTNKYGQDLWYHQQKYMPLQLTLKTVKSEYKTDEPINFMVTVTNTSPQNIKVKDLSQETLFFRYNRKVWGAKEAAPKKDVGEEILLRSGESLSKEFLGSPFQFPERFEIYCSYIMTFKDVKPSSILQVQVVQ